MNPSYGGDIGAIIYFKKNFITVGPGGGIRTSPDGTFWRTIPSLGKGVLNAITASDNLVLALGPSEAWRSEDGFNWKMAASPAITGHSACAYGFGTFVGVGQNGAVTISHDGIQWESATAPGGPHFRGIAFGAGKFVAVGPDAVETSLDGKAWKPIMLSFKMQMNAVAYGTAGFVAVGELGIAAHSLDGESWQTNSFPGSNYQWMNAITFDGKYIAVGIPERSYSQTGGLVFSSTNAIDWQAETSHAAFDLFGVASGGNRAVAVGFGCEIITSTGNGWAEQIHRIFPLIPLSCSVSKGLVVVPMNDMVLVSSNANSFRFVRPEAALGSTNDVWSSMAFGNGQFVMISNYGRVSSSTNGYDWKEETPVPGSGNRSFGLPNVRTIFVNGQFFARTDDRLYSSADTKTWQDSPVFRKFHGDNSTVAYGNGRLLAPPFVSTDGLNWSVFYGPQFSFFSSVAFGNGRFIILGDQGQLSSSSDASSWTNLPSFGSQWADLQFVNDQFRAISQNGKIFSSVDGQTWSETTSFDMGGISNLATDGAIWAASGYSGGLIISWPNFAPRASLTRDDHGGILTSSTQSGSSYRLFGADDLSGTWNPVGEEQLGFGDPIYWPLSPDAENRFFKVLQR